MENKDFTNIALSRHASEVANQLKDADLFGDALTAAKFGMAYAIKYCFEDIDTPEKLMRLEATYDSQGNNYNVGSVDPDRYIANLMEIMYPDSHTPYKFARIIMCRGLDEIGDFIHEGALPPISKYM